MKIKVLIHSLSLTLFLLTWNGISLADLVITKKALPPEDRIQGYIQHSSLRFVVTTGLSSSLSASGKPAERSMRRVELTFNNKTVTVQNSSDKELYVKGLDQHGSVVNLENADYAAIKLGLNNLNRVNKGKQPDESYEALGTALSLLASWPRSMPVLIWQDEAQKISALDQHTVVAEPNNASAGLKRSQAKPLDEAILQNPDAVLRLPDIEPLQALPLQEAAPISSNVTSRAVGVAASDSSIKLCTKMGTAVPGTYPLISPTFWYPFFKVVGWDKYTATVGGAQCLARCGSGCVDSVSGVTGFGKNAYTQDCMDHDMCVAKRGSTSSYCNLIFSDAANDYFSTPCGHDLVLLNTVVSNSIIATSQPATVSSKINSYVVFTIKNNSNTRLPHNNIYFDILVDGKKKTTLKLPRILNAFDAGRYYYQIGAAKAYLPGRHSVKMQIRSTALIQTITSNDSVTRPFNYL